MGARWRYSSVRLRTLLGCPKNRASTILGLLPVIGHYKRCSLELTAKRHISDTSKPRGSQVASDGFSLCCGATPGHLAKLVARSVAQTGIQREGGVVIIVCAQDRVIRTYSTVEDWLCEARWICKNRVGIHKFVRKC